MELRSARSSQQLSTSKGGLPPDTQIEGRLKRWKQMPHDEIRCGYHPTFHIIDWRFTLQYIVIGSEGIFTTDFLHNPSAESQRVRELAEASRSERPEAPREYCFRPDSDRMSVRLENAPEGVGTNSAQIGKMRLNERDSAEGGSAENP
jgi:hypothetical protein